MKLYVAIIAAVFSLAFIPIQNQTEIEIVDQHVDFQFNTQLNFMVEFRTDLVIQEAFVHYQFSDSDHEWVYQGDLFDNERLIAQVELNADNQPGPFETIEYWFVLATDHGEIIESQHFTFTYEDNRYTWMAVEGGPFTLYWHNGDSGFAASVLAAARQGVQRAQLLLPLAEPAAVTLRVYDTPDDVQLIAQRSDIAWQAGHTDPNAGVLLFSLVPGQSLEIQRQVPHEIAHLMLYQSLGAAAYSRLPAWLNEGIASYAEVYSDPTQAELLQIAYDGNSLIPLFSLCSAFPQDAASARLAYAESGSFVEYLLQKYNPTGFRLIFDAYAASGDCLNAPADIVGKDLIALEGEWRAATFAKDSGILEWVAAFPWQPILASAAVAGALFLILKRVGYSKK